MEYINAVDRNLKFSREDSWNNDLAILECTVHTEKERSLDIDVYRKPNHTDQYLLFDSHQPKKHKLGVIRNLQHKDKEDTQPAAKKRATRNQQSGVSVESPNDFQYLWHPSPFQTYHYNRQTNSGKIVRLK